MNTDDWVAVGTWALAGTTLWAVAYGETRREWRELKRHCDGVIAAVAVHNSTLTALKSLGRLQRVKVDALLSSLTLIAADVTPLLRYSDPEMTRVCNAILDAIERGDDDFGEAVKEFGDVTRKIVKREKPVPWRPVKRVWTRLTHGTNWTEIYKRDKTGRRP